MTPPAVALNWKRVGRETHSCGPGGLVNGQARFKVYCAGTATWVATEPATGWRTSLRSRIGAMDACERYVTF